MATRQNRFLLKRSNIPNNVPSPGQILLGELALNTSDVILYASGTSTNSILPIGWDRVSKTGDTMSGTLYTPSISATTISATTYYGLPSLGGDYLPLSGGTVYGPTNFTDSLSAKTIQFDTSYTGTVTTGQIGWNTDFGVPQVGMVGGNVTQKIGESVYAYVKNVDTTTLNKGEVVYIFGASGDKISIKRASNTGDTTSSKTLGIVAESIAVNGLGYVITQGTLDGLNLGSYTDGDILWLSDVPGQFTKTKQYAPSHLVFVGVVQRANNGNGQLYVKPQNGYELDELHNVLATGATYGDLLVYSGYNGYDLWVNSKTLNGTYRMNGLSATTISATSITINPTGTTTDLFNVYTSGGSKSLVVDLNGSVYNNGSGGVITNTAFGVGSLRDNTVGNNNTAYGYNTLINNISGSNNTAIGVSSLPSNTTGVINLAISNSSLFVNTTGSYNIGLGQSTLQLNTTGNHNIGIGYLGNYGNTTGSGNIGIGTSALGTSYTGSSNTAIGYESMRFLTGASYNTAIGYQSMRLITNGLFNVATGYQTLYSNTTGASNVANGYAALYNNTSASNNIGIGNSALFFNSIGDSNVSIGYQSLYTTTGISSTVAVGHRALRNLTTGINNTAIGFESLYTNTTGATNTAVGYQSLYLNTGTGNSVLGRYAGYSNTTGGYNTALGLESLFTNSTGNFNIGLGYRAGFENTTGNSNVAIGVESLRFASTVSNVVSLGRQSLYFLTSGDMNTALGFQTSYGLTGGTSNTTVGYRAGFQLVNGSGNTIIGANSVVPSGLTNSLVLSDGNGIVKLSADSAHHLFIPNSPSSGSTTDRLLVRSSNGEVKEIDTVTAVLKTKSGVVAYTSFTGSPYSYDVVFVTPFTDALYSPQIIGYDSRSWSISNVTSSGFRIETNSTTILTNNVYWTVTKHGEN